jgi:hypothetical protein
MRTPVNGNPRTRILANDPDPLKLLAAVTALGYDPAETPIEDIPCDDVFPGASGAGHKRCKEFLLHYGIKEPQMNPD